MLGGRTLRRRSSQIQVTGRRFAYGRALRRFGPVAALVDTLRGLRVLPTGGGGAVRIPAFVKEITIQMSGRGTTFNALGRPVFNSIESQFFGYVPSY